MTPQLIVFYIVGSLVVGWAGRNRRIGLVGFFLLSLLITPVLGLLTVWLTAPSPNRAL
jgi:hypothetical protein